jgi:hypothetical protein
MRFEFHQHLTESLGCRQSGRFHTLRLPRYTSQRSHRVGAALRRLLSEFDQLFFDWARSASGTKPIFQQGPVITYRNEC